MWILCLVAFTFGPMMPILFLYALLGLVVLYVTAKLRIAYSVRRLPKYDQKMNKTLLTGLYYMPAVYCLSAAWLYSNQ